VSEWVASQLRNGLRSLEWDLDDLEATLAIAKRQGLRDNKEISSRLNFIIKTRQEIQVHAQEQIIMSHICMYLLVHDALPYKIE